MAPAAAVKLTLLSRAYCHLCDEMLEAVRSLATARGVPISVVDVDGDPALEREFGDRVPVLFVGAPRAGDEVCHHRFDRERFDALLPASAARRD